MQLSGDLLTNDDLLYFSSCYVTLIQRPSRSFPFSSFSFCPSSLSLSLSPSILRSLSAGFGSVTFFYVLLTIFFSSKKKKKDFIGTTPPSQPSAWGHSHHGKTSRLRCEWPSRFLGDYHSRTKMADSVMVPISSVSSPWIWIILPISYSPSTSLCAGPPLYYPSFSLVVISPLPGSAHRLAGDLNSSIYRPLLVLPSSLF